MKIDKFVLDLREKINVKNQLLQEKSELDERLKNAKIFFEKASNEQVSISKVADAVQILVEITDRLADINTKLLDVDIIIVTMLEAYLTDCNIKFKSPSKINDGGDILNSNEFFYVPYKDNDNFIEIIPDDLWFLKIIKQAIGAKDIEVISKEDYYIK